MTNPQQPERNRPGHSRRLGQISLTVGAVLVLAGAGAAWWGWVWLHENFSAWASAQLSKALKRPVYIGELERVTLSGVRVGPSSIPATETDLDAIALQSVQVSFSLWDLWRRELKLDAELESLEAYFEQNAELQWISTDFDFPERAPDKQPLIEVKLGTIRFQEGKVALVPYAGSTSSPASASLQSTSPQSASPQSSSPQSSTPQSSSPQSPPSPTKVGIQNIEGDVQFSTPEVETGLGGDDAVVEAQQIDFQAKGNSASKGNLAIAGSILLPPSPPTPGTGALQSPPPEPSHLQVFRARLAALRRAFSLRPAIAQTEPLVDRQVRLNIQAQNAQATDIAAIVFSLFEEKPPISITSGDISGNVDLEIRGQDITVNGTSRVSNGSLVARGLPQPVNKIEGQARFQGKEIIFDTVGANLGDLAATAKGTIDLQKGYNLTANVQPFTPQQIQKLFPVELPVPVTGTFVADAKVKGPLQEPNVSLNLASQGTATVDRVQFASLGTTLALSPKALIIDRFRVVPLAGGELVGNGRYTFGKPGTLSLTAQGTALPADALGRPYGLPEAITIGPVSLEGTLSGPTDRLQGALSWRALGGDYPARGDLIFAGRTLQFKDTFVQVGGGTVSGHGLLANGNWNADLQARGIQLGRFVPDLEGVLSGNAQVAGTLNNPTLQGIRGQGSALVALASGTLSGDATLANGAWSTDLQAQGIRLDQFLPDASGVVGGTFQLAGNVEDFSPEGIRGEGQAVIALSEGTITGQGRLADGLWNATVGGEAIQLSQFSNDLQGTLGGQFALSGDVNNLSLAGIQGQGTFVASDGLATLAPRLPRLEAVREPLTGAIAWNGRQLAIQQASTAGIEARGTLTPLLTGPTAPTLADINLDLRVTDYALAALPITSPIPLGGLASFRGQLTGNLDNLNLLGDARLVDLAVSDLKFEPLLAGPINVATAGNVNVDLRGLQDVINVQYGLDTGNLAFDIRTGESMAYGGIQNDILQATITEFPLDILSLPPGGLGQFGTLRGTIETANISGDLSQPTLSGSLSIREPGVGYIGFQRLEGSLAYADRTIVLSGGELQAQEGRYLLTGRYRFQDEPELLAQVTAEEASIQELLTTLQFFELSDFTRGFAPPAWLRRYTPDELNTLLATTTSGDPNATLLEQMQRLAELLQLQDLLAAQEEASPLPPLSALDGKFSGNLTLSGKVPQDLDIGFNLTGRNWTWGETYRVEEVLADGELADGILRVDPIRFASDVGLETPAFVSLDGEVALNPEDDISRTLSLTVRDIPLDDLRRPLRLPPAIAGRLKADATLTGTLANPQVRGALGLTDATINKTPVQTANAQFLYTDARLNLLSSLVVNGEETPLTLTASVPYKLPFAKVAPSSSELLVDMRVADDGLGLINLFTQSIAWQTGKGEVKLELRGSWEPDQSMPDIASLEGFARLEDGVVTAPVLPEPLTDLDSEVRFENDLIIVDRLSGQFSKGELLAQGTFPLLIPLGARQDTRVGEAGSPLDPAQSTTAPVQGNVIPPVGDETTAGQPAPEEAPAAPVADAPVAEDTPPLDLDNPPPDLTSQPLTVEVKDVALNFKGMYNGRVDGRVKIGGSALLLGPQIGGSVVLSNGQLSLPDTSQSNALVGQGETGLGGIPADGLQFPSPGFDGLKLFLDDNIRIVVSGFLDVTAQGNLTINGILPDIQPTGRIRLPAGRINLVTTEFRLAGGDNYAEFRPNLGLDPYLRATLRASIADSTDGTTLITASPFPRNEISDARSDQFGLTNNGGVETVRIRAVVDGPASQIANLRGVTLTSSPARSEGEIISLISGGFLTALESTLGSVGGSGDSFQGLIALAGTALLNNVQDLLGTALSLSELRLYSATPTSGQSDDSSIDIGGEVGFELSPSISVSVQKVFTDITPAQFNVRYRINDQFTVRGTTSYENFDENTGLLLEYETRF